jgi:hypothetical protein
MDAPRPQAAAMPKLWKYRTRKTTRGIFSKDIVAFNDNTRSALLIDIKT